MNKDKNEQNYLPKGTHIRRIILGALLIYIAFTMKDAPANTEGMEKIVMIVAMIIFFIVGAVTAGLSAMKMMKGEYAVPDDDDDEEAEEDEVEKSAEVAEETTKQIEEKE